MILGFLIRKINNQIAKIEKMIASRKLSNFKKNLKHCGQDTYIGFPVRFEGSKYISIGNDVSINSFVHIWGHGGVEIGDDTLIASHVSIVSITHDPNADIYRKTFIEKKVTIGKNVWIGTHATILPGVSIGDNAIIGAGAVVTKDVPCNSTALGIPAKVVKYKQQKCS